MAFGKAVQPGIQQLYSSFQLFIDWYGIGYDIFPQFGT